jgi:hypothetical protein
MTSPQRIVRERRQYNQWVASQTLEDFALRYTADSARKSSFRVGNTALGPIAFLACEAIGGALTMSYGFPNTAWAIVSFIMLMFMIGLPIAYYAAKFGVDIDLLTRGAGFGYLGSTITSLIYASFTFLLFSIEASILSVALQLLFGIPLAVAHILSSLVVIPIAIYGISLISRFQLATQPIWLLLQFVPILYILWRQPAQVAAWTHFAGIDGSAGGSVNVPMLGMAASMLLSLLPQIGEQVDYLRFLPAHSKRQPFSWWTALLCTGPGWVLIGGFKLFAGSFLTVLALAPRNQRGGCQSAHTNVPGGVSRSGELADPGVGHDRSPGDRLPAENQRYQCVCRIDCMVELFLEIDAQSSGSGRMAGVQRGARVGADGEGDLSRHRRHLADLREFRRGLDRGRDGGLGCQQTSRLESSLHRISPRLSVRRESGRDRRTAAVDCHFESGVPRRLRHDAADPVAVRGVDHRLRGGAGDRLGDCRPLLPRASGRGHAAACGQSTLQHL